VLRRQDCFVIMPTGAGKSLCYQLPALLMPGTALVISPLIALMKNQVDQMRALDIAAAFLNSSLTKHDCEIVKNNARAGQLKLLYVAPETLVRAEFLDFLETINLSFVAIDEAHCISEWGHDFRPEYRRIRPVLNQLPSVPLIALTATATPKVQLDIQQNLKIEDANVFKTSFNRTNLYYEVRHKTTDPTPEIIRYIKQSGNKSGIVYCLSRRRVEELAELLTVNGIKAVPYHAGLDSETRARHQDMFLMEEVQVVVATIAFGMGIDKPDVRFVIHFDVPKSLESYYQETGRAGRDGLEGNCILYYSYSDIIKLEKFMRDKPLSEREASKHLLIEMAAFSESGMCRRKQLLHYFGEEYDDSHCTGMCDNCRSPRESFDGTAEATLALQMIQYTGGRFVMNYLISLLRGSNGFQVREHKHDQIPIFGQGKHLEEKNWKSIFIQLLVRDYVQKDIQEYGVIRLTDKGRDYLQNPHPITFVKFNDYERGVELASDGPVPEDFKTYDPILFDLLVKLRAEVARKHKLPAYVVFQEPSLEDIATKYPITLAEFEGIVGVGRGKAQKFAAPFIELVKRYVEENEIERPESIIVKTKGKHSEDKIYVIQQIDRKTPLDEIAEARKIPFSELLAKIEHIVYSGSRLNIDYYLSEILDEDRLEEAFDYFRNATSDHLAEAQQALPDFTREELQLARIKFYSDNAN
jgi:ATP-dependent DNA helicase RecQ